jgi:hypothetical protein
VPCAIAFIQAIEIAVEPQIRRAFEDEEKFLFVA